jgi:hypothetical protein
MRKQACEDRYTMWSLEMGGSRPVNFNVEPSEMQNCEITHRKAVVGPIWNARTKVGK